MDTFNFIEKAIKINWEQAIAITEHENTSI